jgi:hypothetical protein
MGKKGKKGKKWSKGLPPIQPKSPPWSSDDSDEKQPALSSGFPSLSTSVAAKPAKPKSPGKHGSGKKGKFVSLGQAGFTTKSAAGPTEYISEDGGLHLKPWQIEIKRENDRLLTCIEAFESIMREKAEAPSVSQEESDWREENKRTEILAQCTCKNDDIPETIAFAFESVIPQLCNSCQESWKQIEKTKGPCTCKEEKLDTPYFICGNCHFNQSLVDTFRRERSQVYGMSPEQREKMCTIRRISSHMGTVEQDPNKQFRYMFDLLGN